MISPPFMRRIFIDELTIAARIGILEHELRATQPIYVSAEFDTRVEHITDDKDIDSVLDYRQLRQTIIECCTSQHVNLLETLIEHTAQTIMQRFPSIQRVHLRISKPQAFTDCAGVGIEIELTR